MLLTGITACSTSTPVNEKVRIKTVDTELYADIRGNDQDAPILLYLHGGPASPLGILTFMAYSGPQLEDHFVVVYLQQRGIMKSARVPDSSHTVQNYVADVHYVVQYLKTRFAGRDINLFGHSWGGVLAYLYLLEHEGNVERLVTACAPLDVESVMRARYKRTLKWAEETGNKDALSELSGLKVSEVDDDLESFGVMSKWSSVAYGGMMREVSPQRINEAIEDEHLIGKWLEESRPVGELMFDELMNISLGGKVGQLHVPLLVVAGKDDVDSPWVALKESTSSYGGETKFMLFENSHHLVFVDEEEKFVRSLVSFLSE
jgi:pimeloyl-ACP methyl ester carboxylesterase